MSDDRILGKILALLAQAEGTSNQEEASAYSEKAQHLASVYAIDLEMARYRQKSKVAREEPTSKRISVGEPGRRWKNRWWTDLFLAVARNNDLRCTIAHDNSYVNVYGYPSDIAVTEMLYASLSTQMVGLCNLALQTGEHKKIRVHGATFRTNFYVGWRNAVAVRLAQARDLALKEQAERDQNAAALQTSGQGVDDAVADRLEPTGALVMIQKAAVVDDYYVKARGKVAGSYAAGQPGRGSLGAMRSGYAAGERANLGGGGGALPGPKKQIG